jgi:membrane protease subunit HflC
MSKLSIVLLVLVGLVLSLSIFTVHEREKAILFQLGRIVRSDYVPGLYLKIPIVQSVRKFDARIQTLDSDPELYLTSEKKNVLVDAFVKWRINDVNNFFTATAGSYVRAGSRLSELIKKGLKDEFGKRTIQEVVSGERADIMDILTATVNEGASDFGIEIVDARIKRIDLPQEVSSSVYRRMQAERQRVARDFRSRGEEEAKRIRARAEREREVILAEARRDALQIRGEGDATAAAIYADSFNQDPEFFSFYRSLDAYRNTFNDRADILLLQSDNDFFRYFDSATGAR